MQRRPVRLADSKLVDRRHGDNVVTLVRVERPFRGIVKECSVY